MRTHHVTAGDSVATTITVGRRLSDELVRTVAAFDKIAFLCQPATEALSSDYATAIGAAGTPTVGYTLPDGEQAKSLETVGEVMAALVADGLSRNDAIVAVGGGALTDAAGFIAATFLRGIPVVYVPTTLLGAVDASIGGKTAVNIGGKNLAGTFTHPSAVLVDVGTIESAPNRLRIEGAAEALKTGFIADMRIVEAYEANPVNPDLEAVINRSIAVKVAVVSDDFREHGRRAILNYGHTVGHAIETILRISHGEAVAIGMMAAAAASNHRSGFTGADRQTAILEAVGLPTSVPQPIPALRVRSMMANDKKRGADGLRMVLLEEFESPVVVPVDDATVAAGLAAVGIGD